MFVGMKVLILRMKRHKSPAPDTPISFELIAIMPATIAEHIFPDGEKSLTLFSDFGFLARTDDGARWAMYEDEFSAQKGIDPVRNWHSMNDHKMGKDFDEDIINLDAVYALNMKNPCSIITEDGHPYVPDPELIGVLSEDASGKKYFYLSDFKHLLETGNQCPPEERWKTHMHPAAHD